MQTKNYCIVFICDGNIGLIAYAQEKEKPIDERNLIEFSDTDLGGDKLTRKSTVASVFMLCNGPIYWKTKGAVIAATTSTESELVGMVKAGNEMIYLLNVMRAIGTISDKKKDKVLFGD
ncbi:unnamed protein product [Ambrosiozyma monospora]|uniref:Unnamed protein product n=1 Tax=Ambrosiozyma monospora TaxID=43982 RepID=A0A9W6YZH9_AMBMO|nr:unnamed protein product [Ambrosiozyma monospora]